MWISPDGTVGRPLWAQVLNYVEAEWYIERDEGRDRQADRQID